MPFWYQNPLFLLLVVMAIFIPMERRFPAYEDWPAIRPQFGVDLGYFFFAWSIIFCEFRLVLDYAPPHGFWALSGQSLRHLPQGVVVLLVILITTFCDYWGHRLLHTPKFWPLHVIHHSSEKVDWLAATRVHPLELLFLRTCQTLPLVVLGFPKEAYLVHFFFWFIYGDFTHANLRFRLGPLANWVVNPDYHHWHHSRVRDGEGDTNYGGFLSLWDRAFGTFHLSDGTRPSILGVKHDLPPSFLGQLIYPFQMWGRGLGRHKWTPEKT